MNLRRHLLSLVIVCCAAVVGLIPAASARPAPSVSLVGYRVIAEPEIAERARGGLVTEALVWKLRAVYQVEAGRQILATPADRRGERSAPSDARVPVGRDYVASDVPRQSADFVHLAQARRQFDRLSAGADVSSLEVVATEPGGAAPVPLSPVSRPLPPVVVAVPPPPPALPSPKAPTCEQVLLDQGHHPSHLSRCQGVEQACAVALLRAGHHPQHLDHCKAVEPLCAQALLSAGHHPMYLDECTMDLSPGCARSLLAAGHHPQHLSQCSRVDDSCAIALLDAGGAPSQLGECRL